MTAENVEIVRDWFERWNRGERDVFGEEVDPDVEIASRLQSEPFRGPEGLQAWFAEIDEHFGEWQLVADEWHEVGNAVAAIGHVRMRGQKSGVGLEQPIGWLFTLRDGKLLRIETFTEPGQALEAARAREPG